MKKIVVFIITAVFAFSYIGNTHAEKNQYDYYNRINSVSDYIKNNVLGKNKKQKKEDVNDILPDTVYTFNKENSSEECLHDNPLFCAVENAVKCTVNPDMYFFAKNLIYRNSYFLQIRALADPMKSATK